MLLFRSEEHVDRWCRTWRMERGATFSLETAWRLAVAWLGPDRREPEWRRRTVEETEAPVRGARPHGDVLGIAVKMLPSNSAKTPI